MSNIITIIKKPVVIGVLVFISLFALTQYLSYQQYLLNRADEQREITNAAIAARERLQIALDYSLAATKALGFIVEKYGVPKDFDSVAMQLLESNKFIDAIQLVKGGVITNVYPLKGNEAAIGYNILADTARNKEALKAIERKQLFFSGPFELKQDGLGIVGRQPIFINKKFWGFAAVIIKLPTLLKASGIDSLENNDFIFQFSKINPNTHKEEFFLPKQTTFKKGHFVVVEVPDGEWNLYVQSKTPKKFFAILPFVVLGIILSLTGGLFAGYSARQPEKLGKMVKEKTQQLRASENNYRTVLERITDAFVALDRNWCYTFLNDAALATHPAGKEATIGKVIWDVHPEMKGTIFWDKYHEAMETGKTLGFESYYPPMDTWFSVKVYPSSDGVTILYRDSTESKRAEEELNQNHAFIESIINASPDIIYIYDIEERKNVYINEGIQTNLGYTDAEIKEMGNEVLSFLMHPKDFEDYLQNTYPKYAAIKDKEIIPHEFRMKDKKGNWRWLYTKESIFLRNADGTPKHIFGITTDITESKTAEQDLKKFNERFEMIARTTNDALWECNFETGELWANQTHQHLYGLTTADPVPNENQWEQKIHPDDLERIIAAQRNALASNKNVWISEYRFETKNGFIDIYDRTYIVRNASGKPIRLTGTMMDITERKKAEEELRLSESLTRKIFEAGIIGFIFWDVNGEILDANDYFLEMTGYSRKDLEDKKINWSKMTPPEYAELDHIGLEQIASTGICLPFEKEYICKDGSRLPVLLGGTAFVGNNPEKGVAYVMDISERKKAEKNLEESKNYLSTILETEPECVKVLNRKGELLFMNPSGLAMIEADNEQQVLGHRMTELVVDKYRTGFNRLTKEVFNGIPGTYEFEVTGLKGGHRWLETHAVPLKDTTGKIITLLGVTRDITNRKLTELELAASEIQYRRLFETAKDGILIIDADTGLIKDVNPFLMELLDYPYTEFIGKQIWEISLFKDIAANMESFKKLQKEGYVRYENLPLENKSGKAMWVEFISNSYSVNGNQVIQCNIRDMTDRKKAKDEILFATDQLRQLTAHLQTIREEERKRIGREIHDELGQQLTAIKMDVVWIDKKTTDNNNPIKNKLKNIITLLDGSNQSVRKILSELRPGNLENQALTETMEWQGRQFTDSTGVPVKFITTETSLTLSEETATCIFRVYQESLTNIMRYAAAKMVSTSLNPQGDNIILTVEDDGVGFDMVAVQKKKTFGLLGMKERVLSLNGKFELISAKGKGTKIVVSLPYKNT